MSCYLERWRDVAGTFSWGIDISVTPATTESAAAAAAAAPYHRAGWLCETRSQRSLKTSSHYYNKSVKPGNFTFTDSPCVAVQVYPATVLQETCIRRGAHRRHLANTTER